MSESRETIVISLGGSMIVPGGIDTDFLAQFKTVIKDQVVRGNQVYIIAGGGSTARKYIHALQELHVDASSDNLDWMGIHATVLNAHLIRLMLGDITPIGVIKGPDDDLSFSESIVVTHGWEPGNSSDYPTVMVAGAVQASKVVNLSNIDYVYDQDPKKNPNAKPLKHISWENYLKLIPSEWRPGLNTPFDPVASRKAQERGLEVAIMNGDGVENLANYLAGNDFKGTIIK
jgi:uridylate kinase